MQPSCKRLARLLSVFLLPLILTAQLPSDVPKVSAKAGDSTAGSEMAHFRHTHPALRISRDTEGGGRLDAPAAMAAKPKGAFNGTPVGTRAWDGNNPFWQPEAMTNYWGSGDVDGDGIITPNDATLANQMAQGSLQPTITADVNGDGIVDASDVALINGAVGGATLPGWWNKLSSRADREAWLNKVLALDTTSLHPNTYWWVCVQYSLQTHLHGAFYRNDLFGTYFSGGHSWFNIPLYMVDLGDLGHAINAILVGDDPLNGNDWRLIEPDDDSDATHQPYLNGHQIKIIGMDLIQVGGGSYMGGEAKVVFSVDTNGVWTVQSHSPNLVLTRPVQQPPAPDNRPDLWNPKVVASGAGLLLMDRQRDGMPPVEDVHVTDLPLVDPPPAKPLVFDSEYSRLLDAAPGVGQSVHLLWTGGSGYIPGVFYGLLNTGTRTLSNVTRLTATAREIHGGRILVTASGDIHAFWSARCEGCPDYTTGVYWRKWNGSSWSAEQNVGASGRFADYAGDWHEPDPARYFFDVVIEQGGSILLVWAAFDDSGNITMRESRYNGTWSAADDIEALGVAGGVALARDSTGVVHLAYFRTNNISYNSHGNLLHRSLNSGTWSAPDTIDGGGLAACPRMVAGTNGAIYLIWQRDTISQRVLVWKRWSSIWSPDHLVTVRAGADAYYPSADFLADGRLAMAWSSRSADRATIETAYVQELNLSVSLSHAGSFTGGDIGRTYTATVSNAGPGPTLGTFTVTDTLPAGLTATAISGSGWNCTLSPLSCSRTDPLAQGASYPAITITVNVAANASGNVTNTVTLSNNDEALIGSNSASDVTNIAAMPVPALSVTTTHVGNFAPGQHGAIFTVTVSNAPAGAPTSGMVTVIGTPSSGLLIVSLSGAGWSCGSNACSRSDALNAGSGYPAITITVDVLSNATSPQLNQVSVLGGGSAEADASDSVVISSNTPLLSISKSHSGNFTQGQSNAIYTITVSNGTNAGATTAPVTVTETVPAGLTLVSMSGSGWSCASNACTRNNALAGGVSYPTITATVSVAANAGSPVVNQVSVSGGGSASANASDSTMIIVNQPSNPPVLNIGGTHSGSVSQGQQNAAYTVTVSNASGAGPTTEPVTVTDIVPSGLTLVSMSGTGWSCASNTCTRSDALAGGASYPIITALVNVAANASSPQVNQVSVTGGGSAGAATTDSTIILAGATSLSLSPSTLNFSTTGALVTSPQTVLLTFSGGTGVAWTASSNKPNIVVTPPAGAGNAILQITVSSGASGVITIAAPGATNAPRIIQVNVTAVVASLPFGSFDTPADKTTGVAGAIAVTGWALDSIEVTGVGIWREPVGSEGTAPNGLVFIGDAVFVAGARPDVQTAFPNSPLNNRAGWGYMLLTNFLPSTNGSGGSGNGTYKLHAIITNRGGQTFDLGAHMITVDNVHASRPFGTIDTPAQGGTISGNAYVNFGWALTQNPYCIPEDGSSLSVQVDGVTIGHPAYGQNRADIANAFPGLCNSDGAVGFFFLDTTKLSNGVHTLAWVGYDNQNRGDGFGSRYFTVQNSGSMAVPEDAASELATAKHGGDLFIEIGEMGRIEVPLGARSGHLLANGELGPLPIGSTLKGGVFYWQLGPGFSSEYPLVFERPDGTEVHVMVRVQPNRHVPEVGPSPAAPDLRCPQ